MIVAASAVVLSPAAPAAAQCPPAPRLEDAVARANTVFVGRVLSVENRDRTAEVEVLSVWKGRDLSERVTLEGGSSDLTAIDPDDRTYRVGVTYLVVVEGTRSPFGDDRCTATRPYNGLPMQIPLNLQDVLGAETGRAPLPLPDADEGVAAARVGRIIVIVAVAALLIIGMIVVTTSGSRSYRRRAKAIARARASDEPATEGPPPSKDAARPRKRRLAGWLDGMTGRSGGEQLEKLRASDRKRQEEREE
jgi:hypothetical protein